MLADNAPTGYHDQFFRCQPLAMRLFVRLFLLSLIFTLAACSSAPKNAEMKLDQSGALKVHPGLLGLPVPPELQQAADENRRRSEAGSETTARADTTAPTGKEAQKPGAEGKAPSPNSVYFDYKDATLKSDYASMLEAHARKLAENPKARLRVEGNADERGGDGFNKRLGLQRAEAVKRALTEKGAGEKQIKAVSNGEAKPLAKGHDEASWAENRRADLIYERED